MNEQKSLLTKWLQSLFYLHIVSLVIAAVNAITNLDGITKWINWAVSIGAVICLFRLQNVNQRYQKSAVFRAIMLGCSVFASLLGGIRILGYAASILALVTSYQEYHAHSELVAQVDDRLSRKWAGLFLWSLVLGMVSGLVSSAAVMIGVLAEANTEQLATVAVVFVLLVGAVEEILYLRYMQQTLRLFEG